MRRSSVFGAMPRDVVASPGRFICSASNIRLAADGTAGRIAGRPAFPSHATTSRASGPRRAPANACGVGAARDWSRAHRPPHTAQSASRGTGSRLTPSCAGRTAERAGQLVAVAQVVERVVDARHEVEAAEGRQPPQVGRHEPHAGHLESGLGEHRRREVAPGHVEAAAQERQEALARAAREVEHRASPQAVALGQLEDLRGPALVVRGRREPVVERRERVVGGWIKVGCQWPAHRST